MASKYEIIKNWIEDIADDSDIIQLVRQVTRWDGSFLHVHFSFAILIISFLYCL